MRQTLIDRLASNPKIFIFLRTILEAGFKGERAVIEKYLAVRPDDNVLDIGCGTGEFSVFFPPENYTGLDIEKNYVDFAGRNYRGRFMLGDATKLPFGDATFSKILIIGVLHHLTDRVSRLVLKEAGRVLKDGGQFLVMEDLASPNDPYLTRLVHRLDKGQFMRTAEGYEKLLDGRFKVLERFKTKSGLCPYQVFLLAKSNG